jgi:NADH-quinone oxidoreductase subunit B
MQGIDEIIPVDAYVAGCPPRPEGIIDAILEIQKRIASEDSIIKERDHSFKGSLDA